MDVFNYTDYKEWQHSLKWQSDYSSCVDAAYYDADTKWLYVWLVTGGEFIYTNVSNELWEQFKDAGSAGGFWNYTFRGAENRKAHGLGVIEPDETPDFVERPAVGPSLHFTAVDTGSEIVLPDPAVMFEYAVAFDVNGMDNELIIEAANDHDALEKFNAALAEYVKSPFVQNPSIKPLAVSRVL